MMTDIEYGATKIQIERENEEKLKRYPILEKQLDIAVKALKKYAEKKGHIIAHNEKTTTVEYESFCDGGILAHNALTEIKELDNDNQAK